MGGGSAGAVAAEQGATTLADEGIGDGEGVDVELGRVGVDDALGVRVVHDPAVRCGSVAEEAALESAVFESAEVPIVVGDVGVHVTAERPEDGEVRGALFGELNRGGGALPGGDVVAAIKSGRECI